MTTTTNTNLTDETIAWLEAHGFTSSALNSRHYHHPSGNAMVEVVDDEAACFTVYAFTRDRARSVLFQAQLTRAPLSVFAAIVTAALA